MAFEDSTDGERAPLLGSNPTNKEYNSCEDQYKVPAHICRKLYTSHFLSAWNSRVFEFGAVLYLAAVFPGTLVPMSLYAMTRGLSAFVFAPFLGSYIDTANRLQVVRLSIVFQRLAVAASCVAFYILARRLALGFDRKDDLLVLLVVLACVEKVVVVARKDQVSLRTMNSQMRRIDMTCKILGPLFIALIDGVSTTATIVVMAVMNVSSLVVEYYAIALVYHDIPELQESKKKALLAVIESSDSDPTPQSEIWRNRHLNHLRAGIKKFWGDFSFYHHHQVFLPSFALALLGLTVLDFDGQMITYLLSSGYNSTHVGIARTFAVGFEVSATWIAPWLISFIGLVRAGLWMSLWQLTMLVAGTMVFFLAAPEPPISVGGLVIGVIFSRLGLIGFYLCIQVIVQQSVEAEGRGAFSSVEAAYQNIFELFSYGSTLVFSRPDQFKWPVLISNAAITFACLAYTTFVYLRRCNRSKHLWIPDF